MRDLVPCELATMATLDRLLAAEGKTWNLTKKIEYLASMADYYDILPYEDQMAQCSVMISKLDDGIRRVREEGGELAKITVAYYQQMLEFYKTYQGICEDLSARAVVPKKSQAIDRLVDTYRF